MLNTLEVKHMEISHIPHFIESDCLKYCDLTIRMTLYDKLNNEKINNAI